MVKYKDITKFLVFLFFSIVGFSAGMNFFDNVDTYTVESAKGCFEFGLYQILTNEKEFVVFIMILFSALKYIGIMIVGIFSWWLFPIVPMNDFFLGFKMGVAACFAFKIMGIGGFFDCALLSVLIVGILVFMAYVSYVILNRRLYHVKNRRIDTTDKIFLMKTLLYVIIFVFAVYFFFVFLKLSQSRLCGLTQTFL